MSNEYYQTLDDAIVGMLNTLAEIGQTEEVTYASLGKFNDAGAGYWFSLTVRPPSKHFGNTKIGSVVDNHKTKNLMAISKAIQKALPPGGTDD